MELEPTQASLRRSSRKRACPTNVSSPEAADEVHYDLSLGSITRKRQAVEHSAIRTPLRETSVGGNAARPSSGPARTAGESTTSRALRRPRATPTLSHEDPVPADCCSVCRRRGGNYAYTCVYEDDSGNCKRCVKEKQRCRPATEEEIAKSEARCPQCKKRGLNNCWYEGGKSSCEPCIKWKKDCGAPTKRQFNANTRMFLGQPSPESEQDTAAINGKEDVAERSHTASLDAVPSSACSPPPSTAALPSRPQNFTEQSTAKAVLPLARDNEQTPAVPTEPAVLSKEQEILDDRSGISERPPCAHSVHDDRHPNRTMTEHGAAPLNCALVRGSRRCFKRDELSSPPLTAQEATLEDSATEEVQHLTTNVEMTDDDSADLQLILESTKAATSPVVLNTSTLPDVDTTPLSVSDSDLSDRLANVPQRRTLAADAHNSRLRRGRARPSYIESAPSDASDPDLDEDEDEVWDPEFGMESANDDDEEFEDAAQSSADEDANEDINDSVDIDIEPEPQSVLRRRSQLPPKQGKGLDLSLPPLNNIHDITTDMTSKALELGLSKVLQGLNGHSINVATMCSGTESPLLFLQMLSQELEARGETPLRIEHRFSAEIDATKQAYIERDFHPPVLFRDVRQLGDEISHTATTAYGAEEEIPGNLDLVIAGFVCKDLSALNSRKKTVDDQGETGDTWRAIYFYVKRFQPGVVLLENVKSDQRTWDDVVSRWSDIGYEAAWVYCDTKNYYIPQTRERMYMIAINRKLYGTKVHDAVREWRTTMKKFQRQCSSPYEAFLVDLPVNVVDHPTMSSEPEWSLCKLRYDQIRSDQKLGTRRPITQWSENGTLHPPDYANRKWFDSQSSRVYDAIDVAHLLAARDGHDSMYKMKIWDVSQNVDRFNTGMGLVPCITPGGCDFGSSRQDALSGSQTLVLQGMPLSKLHFAGETQRECQDLAGNAMSTTVIGASLISAILHGSRAFRNGTSIELLDSAPKPATQSRLVRAGTMLVHEHRPTKSENLDVARLLREAKLTSRLCACEGERQIAESDIKICLGCSHTACTKCASNPRHQYEDNILGNSRQQTTNDFIRYWRQRLPSHLRFSNLRSHLSALLKERSKSEAYVKRIVEVNVESQQFNLSKFVRCDNAWIVVYLGDCARVELSIGDGAQWRLFVDCSSEVSSNSDLRKALDRPIARAKIDCSLLDVEWEVFAPLNEKASLTIRSSGGRSRSWRSLLGLPDYTAETIPAQIEVCSTNGDTDFLEGEYHHLPHCGTAENSLYKRVAKPTLYFFLDPDPIGEAKQDSFIFGQDCSRKRYGESRMIVARLDSSWRPWQVSDANEQHSIGVMLAGSWSTVSTRLATSELAPAARVLRPGTPLTELVDSCTNAVAVLDVSIPKTWAAQAPSDYYWALGPTKVAPSLSDWQPFVFDTQDDCDCAPSYPSLLWSVDQAGKATPHEDRKAAATFERGIKTRCPIFHEQSTKSKDKMRIEIAINVSSLVHRAKGRIARSLGSTVSSSAAWRLLTDHLDTVPSRFPKFNLRSNASDAPFAGRLNLERDLRGAQPQALAWMHTQEAGIPLTVTEVEEAVHHDLGWRAEARAQTSTVVRGGVLADLPSFGKTVTTIALIQSEFEVSSPEAILEQNRLTAECSPQLIETAATLIVCPPHIAMQWQTELELFLGDQQYAAFNIHIIRDFAELKVLTIDDLQRSRVLVVSWTVLSDEEYISELAWTTAMPEPANSSCRAFDAWMDAVNKNLPSQVHYLQSMNLDKFKQATRDLLKERLQQPEFQASLPLRLQHGNNYRAYQTVRAGDCSKKSAKPRPAAKRKSSTNREVIPLLHMFSFNRLVIDEYHYLNDYKKIKNMFTATSVRKIAAHKRWILSGTPALANFTDINNIASFLGVKLGRFAVGPTKLTLLEEFLVGDQTAVERFLCKTEVMSHQWHQTRHDRAQGFLDIFVRQNEASLGHIPCHEELRAVYPDVAHHAVYLELSQHLNSQRMQVKRLKNKAESDRVSRLNASLNNSKTAEDALLKAALLYETSAGESGLDALLRKRSEQRRETEQEILRLMRAFEWHKLTGFKGLTPVNPKKADAEENTVPKLWTSFSQDIKKRAWLGDYDTTTKAKLLLLKAEAKPTPGGLEELKEASKEKMIREAKKIMSHLRDSSVELALRMRSERFISNVKSLLQPLCKDSHDPISCDAGQCQRTASISGIYLASHCGHLICKPCLLARGDDENCIVTGCSCTVQTINLIKATDLGSTPEKGSGCSFGRKMDAIARLIKKLPADDQGLLFAPNDETVAMLGEVLDYYGISFYTPCGCSPKQAAKIIEEFKASVDGPEDRPKVLLLNLTSETAAGVNLTNANHIIFVSPLLVESQYKYDSAMTQAIARSRRYGQEKQVHIYHFAAIRTIDVDILEHRHKRTNGITAAISTVDMPSRSLTAREKTKLVKDKHGSMALVPMSWLADETVRKGLGVGEELEKFTSLINFSETFEDGEE